MIYENPQAYLLGLEGVALLRAFTGDFDRDFVQGRIAEIAATKQRLVLLRWTIPPTAKSAKIPDV